MFIIIAAALIMVTGGVVTFLQQFSMGPFSGPEVITVKGSVEHRATLKEDEKLPKFLLMDPLVIAVFQGDRVAASFQFELKIETMATHEREMYKLMPKLKDAFIRDLHGFVPRLIRGNKEIDTEILSRRLMVIAARTVGKGLVDGVLIQTIIDRPAPK